jgi:CRP-like cAMP-binding protein
MLSREQTAERMAPFFRRLLARDNFGEDERQALIDAAEMAVTYEAGQDIVTEDSRPTHSILMTSGFSCRYGVLADGTRQITAVHTAGDFVDLHGLLLKEMDHAVGALTDCTVLAFPHGRLVKITERFPHLTRLLWLLTLLDGAMHRQWLVGMGRLSATQRTAHFICELYTRLSTIGQAHEHAFAFPVTQAALADVTGISAVHVNRVLQELRQSGMIGWEGGQITIKDWEGLAHFAQFDGRYLHLVRESR